MDLLVALIQGGTAFDLAHDGADLLVDEDGLLSAVMDSLFTDRRANADDVLPDGTNDRRGCWQDAYEETPGDLPGSRDWLLARAKEVPETLTLSEQYAREALQWMIDDRVATAVDVTAMWVRSGVLGRKIAITLADGSRWERTFNTDLRVR